MNQVSIVASVVLWPWFLLASAATVAGGVVVGALTAPFDRARRSVLWVNHLVWGRMLFTFGPLWTARRTVPEIGPGPYVIVSNHVSVLDIPLNMGLPLPIRVCAREALFDVPVMGWYMRFSRQIRIETGSREAVEGSLAACRQAIEDGVSVLVFPEGSRSDDGRIGTFQKGAFKLAQELGVPVLPVVVDGSQDALPKGQLLVRSLFTRMRMTVLPPVSTTTPEGAPIVCRVLARRVRDAMVSELDRMRAEAAERPVLALDAST